MRIIERREIRQLLIGHVVDLTRHKRNWTTSITDIFHLLEKVTLAKACKLWKRRCEAVAIGAVTGCARSRQGFARGRIALQDTVSYSSVGKQNESQCRDRAIKDHP